jgi:hypothetical protein
MHFRSHGTTAFQFHFQHKITSSWDEINILITMTFRSHDIVAFLFSFQYKIMLYTFLHPVLKCACVRARARINIACEYIYTQCLNGWTGSLHCDLWLW